MYYICFAQVHVVPAHMFRKVISITKSHCKLGLTGMPDSICLVCLQHWTFVFFCWELKIRQLIWLQPRLLERMKGLQIWTSLLVPNCMKQTGWI